MFAFSWLNLLAAILLMQTGPGLPTNGFKPAPPVLSPESVIYWNGSKTFLFGVNYPWYNYGTDFGTGGWGKYTDFTTIDENFGSMSDSGAHVVRWWVFGDGRYDPDFNADGTVSGLDNNVFPDIDMALEYAAINHVYVIFVMMDTAMFSGAQDVSGVQLGGHEGIITSPTIQASYINNALIPFVKHVAGSPFYKSVLAFEVINEPEADIAGFWGGDNFPLSMMQTFVSQCANAIHHNCRSNVTVGSAEPAFVANWRGLGLDWYAIHYYPWMDFNGPPGSGLPPCASLKLDKPCILGEFETVDVSYGLNDTTPLSAAWYLNTAYNYGYAGALCWSMNAGDDVSDWTDFQPVFTNWANAHAAVLGPK